MLAHLKMMLEVTSLDEIPSLRNYLRFFEISIISTHGALGLKKHFRHKMTYKQGQRLEKGRSSCDQKGAA